MKIKRKQDRTTRVLILIFLIGVVVLLYPSVSDWWNKRVQTRAISSYDEELASMSQEDYTAEFEKADAYNEALRELSSPLTNYGELEGYEDILNVTGTGMMGYITIPRIDVNLPIYHGTSASVLTTAAGHLEGTSLPVGGEGTHCVISAHRGLPSATLFSDLDKLTEGDTFTITVLDQTLTYEVDQIRIVEPADVSDLSIVEGEDYVTLLTCTPYGVNTHRLLVRGHRIEVTEESEIVIDNEAYEMDSTVAAPFVAAPLLLILLIILLVKYRKKGE